VALASPPDLVALLRGLPRHWQSQMSLFTRRVGDPDRPEDLPMLQAHSPIHQIERLAGPVLLAHGARDIRVGIDQVRAFAEALDARGAPVTLIEFPAEGHGLVNQRNRLAYFALAETFFATHLGGALEPVEHDLQQADFRVPRGARFLPASVNAGA
jgi:acetyl esterase/lipase